jgi:hypothetical protein
MTTPRVWVRLDRIVVAERELQRATAILGLEALAEASGIALPGDGSASTSRSHSGQFVAVCLGESGRCGIDIEPVDRPVNLERIADRLLTPPELAELAAATDEVEVRAVMLRAWTTREAAWKAAGHGLAGLTMTFTMHGDSGADVVEVEVADLPPLQVRRFRWEGAQVAVATELGTELVFDGFRVD